MSCRLAELGKASDRAEVSCRLVEPEKGAEEEEEHGDDALKVEGEGALGVTVLKEHRLPGEEAGAGRLL